MVLLVDQQERALDDLGDIQSFAQLFSSLENDLINHQRRLIGGLELVGPQGDVLNLSPEEIANLPLSQVGQANFSTISLKDFATAEILQTKAFIPAALEGFERVSELINGQQVSDGLYLLGELTNGLQMFLTAVENIRTAFGINFSSIKDSEGKTIDEAITEIRNILIDMVDGLENKDFVLVNDYLTYELLPHLKVWNNRLDLITEAIA